MIGKVQYDGMQIMRDYLEGRSTAFEMAALLTAVASPLSSAAMTVQTVLRATEQDSEPMRVLVRQMYDHIERSAMQLEGRELTSYDDLERLAKDMVNFHKGHLDALQRSEDF